MFGPTMVYRAQMCNTYPHSSSHYHTFNWFPTLLSHNRSPSREKNTVAQVALLSNIKNNVLLRDLFFTDNKPELAHYFFTFDMQIMNIIMQYYGKHTINAYTPQADAYFKARIMVHRKISLNWAKRLYKALPISYSEKKETCCRCCPLAASHLSRNQYIHTTRKKVVKKTKSRAFSIKCLCLP